MTKYDRIYVPNDTYPPNLKRIENVVVLTQQEFDDLYRECEELKVLLEEFSFKSREALKPGEE